MRSPEAVPALLAGFNGAAKAAPRDFWKRLYAGRRPGRPMVKICGITRSQDAEAAVSLGADALGFVLAPSKRRASLEVLRELRDLDCLKVAVVVTERTNGSPRLDPDAERAVEEGLVDAVQFHGEEKPDECAALAFPYYKAIRVKGTQDVEAMGMYRCPRVLADAWSADAAGGTGKGSPASLPGPRASAGTCGLPAASVRRMSARWCARSTPSSSTHRAGWKPPQGQRTGRSSRSSSGR